MGRLVRLESGRWYALVERDAGGREQLCLSNAERPEDSMRVHIPFSWRSLPDRDLTELARAPELRLWTDPLGIQWRIAVVGPGTPYDFPLQDQYLVFDSEVAWAGITPFPEGRKLGDLTDEELEELRDNVSDLGGGRRRFRPPGSGIGMGSA